jgi:hypothetical protein
MIQVNAKTRLLLSIFHMGSGLIMELKLMIQIVYKLVHAF